MYQLVATFAVAVASSAFLWAETRRTRRRGRQMETNEAGEDDGTQAPPAKMMRTEPPPISPGLLLPQAQPLLQKPPQDQPQPPHPAELPLPQNPAELPLPQNPAEEPRIYNPVNQPLHEPTPADLLAASRKEIGELRRKLDNARMIAYSSEDSYNQSLITIEEMSKEMDRMKRTFVMEMGDAKNGLQDEIGVLAGRLEEMQRRRDDLLLKHEKATDEYDAEVLKNRVELRKGLERLIEGNGSPTSFMSGSSLHGWLSSFCTLSRLSDRRESMENEESHPRIANPNHNYDRHRLATVPFDERDAPVVRAALTGNGLRKITVESLVYGAAVVTAEATSLMNASRLVACGVKVGEKKLELQFPTHELKEHRNLANDAFYARFATPPLWNYKHDEYLKKAWGAMALEFNEAVQKFNDLSISHALSSGQSDERAWEMDENECEAVFDCQASLNRFAAACHNLPCLGGVIIMMQ